MNTSNKISFATIIGLVLSLFGFLFVSVISNRLQANSALSSNTTTLLEFLLVWILTGVVILIVLQGENRPLTSVGVKTITGKEVLLAIVIGIILSLSVPVLTLIVSQIIPVSEEGSIASVAESVPAFILLLGILTAGITEEVLFRGYPIERITEITGNKWVALAVSVVAFILPHVAGWNLTHVIAVVIPLGFVMAGLYLWKRNLIFNMSVHILIDLPLVFIALGSS
jgi:membrane protease YdiL (CAAX protease family)